MYTESPINNFLVTLYYSLELPNSLVDHCHVSKRHLTGKNTRYVIITHNYIDGFHSIFSLVNWRALHHHAPCWLANIHITWYFCPPVSMVKDGMESVCS